MRHKIFIAFLSLLTATSTLDMAKAQSLPYKNKNLPIEERVEDLLKVQPFLSPDGCGCSG